MEITFIAGKINYFYLKCFFSGFSTFQDAAESIVTALERWETQERRRERKKKLSGSCLTVVGFNDIFRDSDTNNSMSTHWSLCLSRVQRSGGEETDRKRISVKTRPHNMSFSYSQLQMRWDKTLPPHPHLLPQLLFQKRDSSNWREIMNNLITAFCFFLSNNYRQTDCPAIQLVAEHDRYYWILVTGECIYEYH